MESARPTSSDVSDQQAEFSILAKRASALPVALSEENARLRKELIQALSKEITLLDILIRRDGMIARLEKSLRVESKSSAADKKKLAKYNELLGQQRDRNASLSLRLEALRGSPLGRVQHAYWRALAKVRK